MFTVLLASQKWKQPKCPPTVKGLTILWHILQWNSKENKRITTTPDNMDTSQKQNLKLKKPDTKKSAQTILLHFYKVQKQAKLLLYSDRSQDYD